MNYDNNDEKILREIIEKTVYSILNKYNLLQAEWHYGKVESVISPTLLSVYVDGSDTPQQIPCSRDDTYAVGDEIWVQFVNRDSKNKFCRGKRGL